MTFFTQFSFDDDLYHIMCESYSRVAEAGPRVLRGPPHPDVAWTHTTQEAADKDVEKLRAYFAGLPKTKAKRKSRDRSAYD